MEKKMFEELIESIKEAGRIWRGEAKPSRVFKYDAVDIKKIRRRLGISQSNLALMIGVSKATLQNWEQGRRKPKGPAKALLRVFAEDPKAVVKALA
jgi:putative transcriptional regulator